MKNEETDNFFEKPFIKEYLFNLQMNEKISLKEFLFTKNVLILFVVYFLLLWYNSEVDNAQKYISIIFVLILLYLFKTNRILKREKYEVPQDNIKNKHSQFFFHGLYSKTVKKVLSQKHYLFILFLTYPQMGYSSFASDVNDSTQTQSQINQLHSEENMSMANGANTKHIYNLSQEKKFFVTKELGETIKNETDLIFNKIKINLEKSKNEIKK